MADPNRDRAAHVVPLPLAKNRGHAELRAVAGLAVQPNAAEAVRQSNRRPQRTYNWWKHPAMELPRSEVPRLLAVSRAVAEGRQPPPMTGSEGPTAPAKPPGSAVKRGSGDVARRPPAVRTDAESVSRTTGSASPLRCEPTVSREHVQRSRSKAARGAVLAVLTVAGVAGGLFAFFELSSDRSATTAATKPGAVEPVAVSPAVPIPVPSNKLAGSVARSDAATSASDSARQRAEQRVRRAAEEEFVRLLAAQRRAAEVTMAAAAAGAPVSNAPNAPLRNAAQAAATDVMSGSPSDADPAEVEHVPHTGERSALESTGEPVVSSEVETGYDAAGVVAQETAYSAEEEPVQTVDLSVTSVPEDAEDVPAGDPLPVGEPSLALPEAAEAPDY